MDRDVAVDRLEAVVETVSTEPMAVPIREVWAFGDVSLGMDPIDRLGVYVTKDLLFRDDADREEEFVASHGIQGVGKTVSAEWAEAFSEHLRSNPNGYAAPEKCLAAHLLPDDEPVHLEVCNSGFERNVTQRLEAAKARGDYEQILDPRGVCLWVDGERSDEAFRKLRQGDLVLPTLPSALEMLGMDPDEAETAAETLQSYRKRQEGASVRGDVV